MIKETILTGIMFLKTVINSSIVVCESASLDPSSLVPTHGDATSSLVRVDVI